MNRIVDHGTARHERVVTACSLDEAAHLIAHEGYEPLAGGTWLMRSRIRGSDRPARLVDLSRLSELTELACNDDSIRIGAMVTHSMLVRSLPLRTILRGLLTAANKSANPNIRNAATVGGNIATADFRAPDIATALLALQATVEYIDTTTPNERATAQLDAFLEHPPAQPHLITSVTVRSTDGFGSHIRLPLRAAGDYPVVIVSAVTTQTPDGGSSTTVAYGAVGPRPSRWTALERALDRDPSPSTAHQHAKRLAQDVVATPSVGVPAAYRRAVLPTLVRRALHDIEQMKSGAEQ
jgi:carbon-monoxide dehydrogenase medium subunit